MTDVSQKRIFFFGEGQAEGGEEVRHLVGGKGASLGEMMRAHLNVPPGFTLSTDCCARYYEHGKRWPEGLEAEIRASLERLEKLADRPFGRGDNPLLVAVRSGAAQSMPGMMDTVLNVGLNPDCVRAMAQRTGNRRGAWEAYRHFLGLYANTVAGIDEAGFGETVRELLQETEKKSEDDLDAAQLEDLCGRLLTAYASKAGRDMPTDPWQTLKEAIDAVFGSWHNERAVTYRKHHHIEGLLGTAVNIQMMCPSEVSGVMFTADPIDPRQEHIIIESSYGLGEAVVLGKVTPDRFVLDKNSLAIREKAISVKEHVVATLAQDGKGQTGARDVASLSDAQVLDLARLGMRVEGYFKHPCDIEWALSQGRFFLLQARAIKHSGKAAADAAEHEAREKVRREEMAALRGRAAVDGTVWSRFNLSEILPDPTPMTWSIVRRFMSFNGGFGLMYQDLGLDPDPMLGDDGVFDLVCGRPYYNLSREPRMQYHQLPFEHPFAALKAAPHKAIYPQPVLNPARGGFKFWIKLPLITFRMMRSSAQLRQFNDTFAARLRGEILPAFLKETSEEMAKDVTAVATPALIERMEHWVKRTLYDFARDSLKPTALAGLAMGSLERALTNGLGPDRAKAALGELIMGVHPDPEADLPAAVRALAEGKLERTEFLKRFGHRGSQEMELAKPRWAEEPWTVGTLAAPSAGASPKPQGESSSPGGTHEDFPTAAWERIATEAKITGAVKTMLEKDLRSAHTFLGLRETGKHYMMYGYALIRRCLAELDRRFKLEGGIFFLKPDELPKLAAGEDLSALIAQRRKHRELALSIEAPQVIFSDDLDAIGRPEPTDAANTLQGVPVSAGVAEGEAFVLTDPSGAVAPTHPYVLVCPRTDPAWVPLFVNAKALVMETGGVLSHGAIVAREFGLPAVAGLPNVHKRLHNGQRVRVDGSKGVVTVLG
jgi:phosphohistidine swiveling domain-containing protein